MATTQLEFVTKLKDEASAGLKKMAGETENLTNKSNTLGNALNGALGALSAYAGFQGLQGLINAQVQSNLTLSQARFYLAGYGKDLNANFETLSKWGSEQQKLIGVGDEYATLVAAKLLPRVKSMSKAQEYGNILLRGQRLGVLNASDAANMMMRATEGNERALKFLLEQMGIAAPSFVSLETLFAELEKRIRGAEEGLSPFQDAFNRLKETMGDFGERAGLPLVTWLSKLFNWINELIDRWPILGDIISGALLAIAGGLAVAGVAFSLSFLAPILTGLKTLGAALAPLLLNPWTWAILALIAAIILIVVYWDEIKAALIKVWDGIKFAWNATVDWLSDKMLNFYNGSIELWTKFKEFFTGIWTSITDVFKSAWEKITGVLDKAWSKLEGLIQRAAQLGGEAKGFLANVGSSIVKTVTGKKATGGIVETGRSYLVGENGPELFTAGSRGFITPNGAGAGGGSILIDMRGSSFRDRQDAVDMGDLIVRRLREIYRIGL